MDSKPAEHLCDTAVNKNSNNTSEVQTDVVFGVHDELMIV